MKAFFLVLVRSLVRLFVRAAELLTRWAAPWEAKPESVRLPWREAPAVGAVVSASVPVGISDAPPEDWLKRAAPPPPEHWLSVVRARAPHFLPAEPPKPKRPSDFRERPKRLGRSAAQPPMFVPRVAARDLEPAIPSEGAGRSVPSPAPARTNARRVVTVIQEEPKLQNRNERQAPVEAERSAKSKDVPELPPLIHAGRGEAPQEVLLRLPEPRRAAPFEEGLFEEAVAPASLEPGLRTERLSKDSFAPPSSPRRPRSQSDTPSAPDRQELSPRWPELPESRPENLRMIVRASLREAQDLDVLLREQEGLPWNA